MNYTFPILCQVWWSISFLLAKYKNIREWCCWFFIVLNLEVYLSLCFWHNGKLYDLHQTFWVFSHKPLRVECGKCILLCAWGHFLFGWCCHPCTLHWKGVLMLAWCPIFLRNIPIVFIAKHFGFCFSRPQDMSPKRISLETCMSHSTHPHWKKRSKGPMYLYISTAHIPNQSNCNFPVCLLCNLKCASWQKIVLPVFD